MLVGAMLVRMPRAPDEEVRGVLNRAAFSARGEEVVGVMDCAAALSRGEHVVGVVARLEHPFAELSGVPDCLLTEKFITSRPCLHYYQTSKHFKHS
jgi:hypothetical protein